MSGKQPFLDTNILIYAHSNDPRSETAGALIAAGGIIGVQQLNEFVAVARRKLRRSWAEILAAIADIQFCCPEAVPLTVSIHRSAIRLAERYGYSMYDSLVIAAALEASCEVLYSEDLRHGQAIDGLTIRNPF